jgi:uncharacterized membrane protein YbaN (DUF454 family)
MQFLWRPIRIFVGFLLLAIGAIGGLIPIFQGWVFGLAGLAILAREFHWARRLLDWARGRWKADRPTDAGPDG